MNQPGITNDGLYTDTTLAFNPDTGKLVWHFQHTAQRPVGPGLGLRAADHRTSRQRRQTQAWWSHPAKKRSTMRWTPPPASTFLHGPGIQNVIARSIRPPAPSASTPPSSSATARPKPSARTPAAPRAGFRVLQCRDQDAVRAAGGILHGPDPGGSGRARQLYFRRAITFARAWMPTASTAAWPRSIWRPGRSFGPAASAPRKPAACWPPRAESSLPARWTASSKPTTIPPASPLADPAE